jgi:hypothetical protein
MKTKKAHVSHGLHARLQPRSVEIAKLKLDSNVFQPPRRGFCGFSFNVED